MSSIKLLARMLAEDKKPEAKKKPVNTKKPKRKYEIVGKTFGRRPTQ